MRAASATGAAASVGSARGAAPSAATPAAGSDQFSNLLAGAAAPGSAGAASGKSAGTSGGDSGGDSAGDAGVATAPAGTPAAAEPAGVPSKNNVTVNSAAALIAAADAGTVPAPASKPVAAAAPTPAIVNTADATNAAATIAITTPALNAIAARCAASTTGAPTTPAINTAATITGAAGNPPKSSKSTNQRAAASDATGPSAGQLTALAVWLLAPAPPPVTGALTDNGARDGSVGNCAAGQASATSPALVPAVSAAAGASLLAAASSLSTAGAAAPLAADTLAADPDSDGAPLAADGEHSGASDSASTADLSALASLVRALPDGAAPSGAVQHAIAVPVSDQNWSHAVAAQVQLFAAANIQNATLRLSPEHLGPVEIHIDVQASQINVTFLAAHAETRTALEQALPTLRALLAHGGLTLGQAQVQGESRSASQAFAARAHNVFGAPNQPATAPAPVRAVGLIDEYA